MSFLDTHFKPIFSKHKAWIWGILFSVALSSTIFSAIFYFYYQNKIFQNIYIDGVYVGGLTQEEALNKLNKNHQPISVDGVLTLAVEDLNQEKIESTISYSEIINDKKYQASVNQALHYGKHRSLLEYLATALSLIRDENAINIKTDYNFNLQVLRKTIDELSQQVEDSGQKFDIELSKQNLVISEAKNGLEVDKEASLEKTIQELANNLNQPNPTSIKINLVTLSIDNSLSNEAIDLAQQRAQFFVGSSINLYGYEFELEEERYSSAAPPANWTAHKTLSASEIIDLLTWPSGFNEEMIAQTVEGWAQDINKPATNAEFEYDSQTLKVSKFNPGQPGLELDQPQVVQAIKAIIDNIDELRTSPSEDINPSTEKTQNLIVNLGESEPEISLANTNNLGINELIGFGDSYYYGSIPTRIHNVATAAQKLNWTIIPPEETFYFNDAVGDVSGETGFKPAYVIRSGRTLLEFGGGVCQVSTTTFRALLDAGVDIIRRLPHSYRVSYYEYNKKPGFDATVYSGNVDLRFINDTPGHILISTYTDPNKPYMQVKLYGTDDGRTSEISNYKQWGYTAPPPTQEIPDPSLAPGERKKVEYAIPGLKTSFDWVVKDKNGEVIHEKTFYSNYRAWGEKWLVGV